MLNSNLSLAHEFYFSPEIFDLEKRQLPFLDTPFFGHSSFVNENQNYFVLPHTGDKKVLTYDAEEISVLHNTCKHRYANLLQGKGHYQGIVCPIHSWSYDMQGNVVNTTGIECNQSIHSLERESIDIHDGFISPQGVSSLKDAVETAKNFTNIDFQNLELFANERFAVDVNWKCYLDTFLDNYHLEAFHPNFRTFLDSKHIDNIFRENFQVQAIHLRKNLQIKTPALSEYIDCYRKYLGKLPENYGSVWICIYPNVIIEISQCFLLVAIVLPESVNSCSVYEYRFVEQQFSQYQDFLTAFDNFMYEIEYEDHELMTRINLGRKELYQSGNKYYGPYHPTKEAGQQQFHNYIRNFYQNSLQKQSYPLTEEMLSSKQLVTNQR